MSVPAIQSTQLHCHYCTHWLGESSESVQFVGMFQRPKDREKVPEPRDTYRCGSCRWVNVFRRMEGRSSVDWQRMELKTAG